MGLSIEGFKCRYMLSNNLKLSQKQTVSSSPFCPPHRGGYGGGFTLYKMSQLCKDFVVHRLNVCHDRPKFHLRKYIPLKLDAGGYLTEMKSSVD